MKKIIGKLQKIASNWGVSAEENLSVVFLQQGWGTPGIDLDQRNNPLCCGGKYFAWGFGTHAPSRIRIGSGAALQRFVCSVGVAQNDFTGKESSRISPVVFSVEVNGKSVFTSAALKYGEVARLSVDLPDAFSFDLVVNYADGFGHGGHVNWCEPEVLASDGKTIRCTASEYPFPMDFNYGKMSAGTFLHLYPLKHAVQEKEDHFLHVCTAASPRLEMTFTCKAYKDFPVLEWKSSFRNPSGQKSDRLSQVKSVVFRHIREQKRLTMTRRRGAFLWHPLDRNSLFPYPDSDSVGNGFRNSYQPVEDILFAGQSWHISATDGRPTDEWLPCVDLNDGNTNFRIAVGWAGQWGADISYDGLNFELSAGVEELDAELEPGEQLDLPSVIFLQSEGEAGTVINLWRRFLTEKIMPKINGVPPVVPLSFMTWGGMSEKQQMKKLAVIDREDLHPEVYWIDAGWFAPESLNEHEPTWSNNVGDWDFDPVSFPEELRNISREVHRQNGKLLLWFEPERVRLSCKLAKEHPEYLIFNGTDNALLDLGNPDAWQYCFDKLCRIIRDNDIDWYRQDFNFTPLEYWHILDKEKRRGITEIRFVQGLYRLWSELRRTFPHLMIDNCASGGKRLDFELFRYSLPLWYSDMNCFADYDVRYSLATHIWATAWMPRFASGFQHSEGGDTYACRAVMAQGINFHYYYSVDCELERFPHDWLRERIAEFNLCRDCFAGDVYYLTKPDPDEHCWSVVQYDLPEEGRGVVTAFRGAGCPEFGRAIVFRSLEHQAMYRVWDSDNTISEQVCSGSDLMTRGIAVCMKESRSSRLIFYQKLS